MIPGSVLWAAAQVRAFGQVLASASELSLVFTITLAAVVVIAYTAIGGMWSNAVLDLVQGVVLLLGVVGLFAVFVSLGGLEVVAALPRERMDFLNERTPWSAFETLAIPVFSTLAAQELAARVLSVRSAKLAAGTTVGAGVLYLAMGFIPVLIGLGAPVLLGAGTDHEQVLAEFAEAKLPFVLYILFIGALVSAILSTLSGALLVAASLAAHNIAVPLRPQLSDAQKLLFNRVAVVVFGVAAYGIALASDSVYELVQTAGALGSSGILVIMVFSLWGKKLGGAPSAYGALIAGTGVYLVAKHLFDHDQPYLLSLAAALLAYLILIRLKRIGLFSSAATA